MRLPKPPDSCTVFTPQSLANAMVRALDDQPDDLWLEPCVGQGALTSALKGMGVTRDRIVAVDLSTEKSVNDSYARTLRGREFLAWSIKTRFRFTKVVANPPYINLDQLDPIIRKSARQIEGVDGKFIKGGSNCWVAFLSASLKLLLPGGSLCFLLPAAWDYANYASSIRDILPKKFESFEVHRSRDPLFTSVRDGCVVVIGRGYKRANHEYRRFEYSSSNELISKLDSEELQHHYIHIVTSHDESVSVLNPENSCILGEVMDIRLGGVTGDAKYFLMSEERRKELNLPITSLRPVLTRSRHLVSGKMSKKEWKTLRKKGERIWLFDPPPYMMKHPSVIAYLELPVESGGCQREKTKIEERAFWYRTILPHRVDGFISGMSRFGPWIAFNDMPRLTATNTLYTISFRRFLTKNQKAAWGLALIACYLHGTTPKIARIYPEGLQKYEPSDLLSLKVSKIPKNVNGAYSAYSKVIRLLLNGSAEEAQEFAEHWLDEKSSR